MPTSYPQPNDTNVYLNRPLWYKFDAGIDIDSVYTGSVVLFDSQSAHVVEGAFSYDAATFTLTFLPNKTLSANTTYTWTIAGADSPDAIPVKLADTTNLPTTVFIDFQTGGIDRIYDPSPNAVLPADAEFIEDGQTLVERQTDTFKVVGSIPTYKELFVDVTSSTIEITFSKDLDPLQDLSDIGHITQSPFIRDTFYFKQGRWKKNVITAPGMPVPEDVPFFTVPTGTWSISGNKLIWLKDDPTNYWNANAKYSVVIHPGLKSIDGDLLDTKDETLRFTTQLYPMIATIEGVTMHMMSINSTLDELDVLRFILLHSMNIAYLCNGKLLIDQPIEAAQRYVEYSTVVSLIDNKLVGKEINAGKTITLGDLSIGFAGLSNGSGLIKVRETAINGAYAARAECLALLTRRFGFEVGERGKNAELVYNQYRNQNKFTGPVVVEFRTW